MKKVLLFGIIIIIVIFAFITLGKIYKSPSNSTANTSNQTATPNSVNIQNFAFNPQTLTIKKGTTITWTNNDSATHNIKSSTFNSIGLSSGDTFKFTFNTPGTFNYNCGIHPTMTGTVIVQ